MERLLHGEPLVEEELEDVMADEGEVKEDREVSSDEMAEGSESEQTQDEDEAMCVACDRQLPECRCTENFEGQLGIMCGLCTKEWSACSCTHGAQRQTCEECGVVVDMYSRRP